MSGESLCWAGLIVLRELTSAATEQPFIPLSPSLPSHLSVRRLRLVVNDEASSQFLNNAIDCHLFTVTVAYCTLRVA